MCFLNSALMQYFFKMNFGSLKVLRSYLEQIPLPNISDQARYVDFLALSESLEESKGRDDLIAKFDSMVFDYYQLSEKQILLIKKFIAE